MQVKFEKKIAIFDQYLASSRVVNGATVRCYKHCTAWPLQVGDSSLVALQRRRLLIAGDRRRSAMYQ